MFALDAAFIISDFGFEEEMTMNHSEKTMEKVVALCKGRGFVYPGSEIYGGLANSWDYGPLGVEFKNNVKKAWMKKFVQESKYNVGLDAAILMNPQTWVASGHVGGFSDPLIDCKKCKTRHRADKLLENAGYEDAAKYSNEELVEEHYNANMDTSTQPTSENAFLNGNEYHTPDYSQKSNMDVIATNYAF